MPELCGKQVNTPWQKVGTRSVRVSPASCLLPVQSIVGSVKDLFLPLVIPPHPLLFTQVQIAISPLTEHYLYPVSTAPIDSPINEI
jgi:hypothetical protein